jgi:hypothetical protein
MVGLTPTRSWSVGEPRSTPKGTPLEGIWRDSYATFDVWPTDRAWLNEALEQCVALLLDRAEALKEIRATGGKTELFVGWFLERSGGDSLPSALLSSLASLGLDLALDVYPADDLAIDG